MEKLLTIPNMLTILRLFSFPLVAVLFHKDRYLLASTMFLAAMLTDIVDGWIAAKFNQRSAVGLYLDPVVDKIVILGLLYELAFARLMSMAIPHLFLARELLQNGVRNFAASKGTVVGANWMGKTKASMQVALICFGLLLPAIGADPRNDPGSTVLVVFRWCACFVLLVSWVFFFVFAWWNRGLFARAGPAGENADAHYPT